MAVDSETKKHIWNTLYSFIRNPYGVAGLMGNLYVESGLKPTNLQNSSEKQLGFSDESYTSAVDRYEYGRFDTDKAGYGLAQWTYPARKQNLLAYARYYGVSIGDLDMQLSFLCLELQNYSDVLKILRDAESIREASDAVHQKYEKPASISEHSGDVRCSYGCAFFNELKDNEDQPEMIAASDDYHTLVTGSKGDSVVRLQQNLLELGYVLPKSGADGIYGRETAKAVSAFQNDHKLVVDGKAGAVTQDILLAHVLRLKAFEQDYDFDQPTLYTVTVSHLDMETADALFKRFESHPVTMEEEKLV